MEIGICISIICDVLIVKLIYSAITDYRDSLNEEENINYIEDNLLNRRIEINLEPNELRVANHLMKLNNCKTLERYFRDRIKELRIEEVTKSK